MTFSVICIAAILVFSGSSMSKARLLHPSYTEADSSMSEKPRTRPLPTGLWGGQHIRLEVSGSGVSIEYDCAHATIDHPISLDQRGRFNVSGRQFSEHGGPVRKESNDGYPARFIGEVKGNSMTLRVENSESKELIGDFSAVHGAEAKLFKCK